MEGSGLRQQGNGEISLLLHPGGLCDAQVGDSGCHTTPCVQNLPDAGSSPLYSAQRTKREICYPWAPQQRNHKALIDLVKNNLRDPARLLCHQCNSQLLCQAL